MDAATDKPFLTARRPPGIRAASRLGRIIVRLNGASAAYRFWIGAGSDHELSGSGRLHVETADGLVRCRLVGDVFRQSPVEFGFHCFWLTRRGMILLVAGWVQDRRPQTRAAGETYIQPVVCHDRAGKDEATRWLG
jgi:hypothetical protein